MLTSICNYICNQFTCTGHSKPVLNVGINYFSAKIENNAGKTFLSLLDLFVYD
jgi:hypothetical protein